MKRIKEIVVVLFVFAFVLCDSVSTNGIAFVGDEQSMDLVAQRALAYAKSHESITKKSQRAVGGIVEFKDLDLGYYLVDSSVGVLCGSC